MLGAHVGTTGGETEGTQESADGRWMNWSGFGMGWNRAVMDELVVIELPRARAVRVERGQGWPHTLSHSWV